MFKINGEPKPLAHSVQQQLFNFINLEDTQALFDDPFGLKRTLSQPQVNYELVEPCF